MILFSQQTANSHTKEFVTHLLKSFDRELPFALSILASKKQCIIDILLSLLARPSTITKFQHMAYRSLQKSIASQSHRLSFQQAQCIVSHTLTDTDGFIT